MTTPNGEVAEAGRKGFAFGCPTSYSDDEKFRDHLRCADLCEVFGPFEDRRSRNAGLDHAGGLHEFTIFARRAS